MTGGSLSWNNALAVGVTPVFNVAHQYGTHTTAKFYVCFSGLSTVATWGACLPSQESTVLSLYTDPGLPTNLIATWKATLKFDQPLDLSEARKL